MLTLKPMKETSVILEPYSAEALYTEAFKKPPPPSLLLTLEGRFVGRGGEGLLPFDGIMRRFRVDTGSVQVWLVSEYSRTLLPVISHGQFYRGETYVIRWSFHLVYTGQREVASSTRNVNNKEQCAYFFWQGSISKITQQGAAALMTVELDEEKGPQIRVVEGKEPPAFCNLFNGRMIIHDGFAPKQFTNGRLSIFEECTMSANPRMFFVRGERASEAHLLEVPPYVISLRSRGIFLIVSYSDRGIFKKSWLWIGAGAPAICRDAANYVVQRLQESCPPELGEGSFRVVELHEKTDAFGVTRDLTGEMAECLACLGSSSSLPSCVHYEDDQRLMVWQLNFTLNDQLIPSRLTYTLEPDITVAPAFGISYGAYPTNDSFYSPELPVPPFPVLISDLEAANQPALFLVLHDHTVYLWHGWWPESTLDTGDGACSSSTTPRSSNSDLATDVGAASPTFAPASPASSRSSGRLRRQQSLFVSPPVASSESRRPVSLLEDYSVNSHSPTADGNLPARGDMAGSLGSSGSGNSIAPPPPSGAGSALSRYLSARYAALKTAKALAERTLPLWYRCACFKYWEDAAAVYLSLTCLCLLFLPPAAIVGPNVLSLAVYAGIEPDSFLHLFPPTVRKEQGACYHLSTGKIYGQADCISTLIDKLDNMKFSLAELRKRPRPPDLDTTRLETYLSNEEFELRNGAEKLRSTYKDGPRIYMESAQKQVEVAEAKIGFLRNQLARLKHLNETPEQVYSPLPHGDDGLSFTPLSAGLLSPTFTEPRQDVRTTWQQQVAELKYRLCIERAASDRVREYFQELYLLQISMKSVLDSVPHMKDADEGLGFALADVINDSEIDFLLDHPDNSSTPTRENARQESIFAIASPVITAVTGRVDVRCIGCEGLLEFFPAGLFTSNHSPSVTRLVDMPPEFRARQDGRLAPLRNLSSLLDLHFYSRPLFRSTSELLPSPFQHTFLVDNNLIWQSNWRPPSSTCWDSVASFEVSQARELWIQVYWKRVYSISNTSTLGSNVSRADMSRAADESLQAADWVLAAVHFRLCPAPLDHIPACGTLEFLDGNNRTLNLNMLPQGTVRLELTFIDPLLTKPRKLRRQQPVARKRKDVVLVAADLTGLSYVADEVSVLVVILSSGLNELDSLLFNIENQIWISLANNKPRPIPRLVFLATSAITVTEGTMNLRQWKHLHFGARANTPQTPVVGPTVIERNGISVSSQVAGREHCGIYTKATSPVRDSRVRTTGRSELLPEEHTFIVFAAQDPAITCQVNFDLHLSPPPAIATHVTLATLCLYRFSFLVHTPGTSFVSNVFTRSLSVPKDVKTGFSPPVLTLGVLVYHNVTPARPVSPTPNLNGHSGLTELPVFLLCSQTEAEKKAQTLPPTKPHTPSPTENRERVSTLPPKPAPSSDIASPSAVSGTGGSNSTTTTPSVPTLINKCRRGDGVYVPRARSSSMGDIRIHALEDRTINLKLEPAVERPVERKKQPEPEAPVIPPNLLPPRPPPPPAKPVLDEDYDDFSSIPEFVAPSIPAHAHRVPTSGDYENQVAVENFEVAVVTPSQHLPPHVVWGAGSHPVMSPGSSDYEEPIMPPRKTRECLASFFSWLSTVEYFPEPLPSLTGGRHAHYR
ncbi:unnamed protein product [Schistocephalus solidus]|uniref:Gelsolin-like domain-containing protein n=1 Tax=Schistocephalus solidus TaxID=70667 RepID=A0A183SGL6_SCHSO|nr:unnamed protein product [Schistocephalus solidus]